MVPASASLLDGSIPEQLIPILVQLDPITLLTTARRVCRTWKIVVESSPQIQWKTWSGCTYGNNPPLRSIRGSYSNKNCRCEKLNSGKSKNSNGENNDAAGERIDQNDGPWRCEDHAYTDQFEINPVAIHMLQMTWKRLMQAGKHWKQNSQAIDPYAIFETPLPSFWQNMHPAFAREEQIKSWERIIVNAELRRPLLEFVDKKMGQYRYMQESILERQEYSNYFPTATLVRPYAMDNEVDVRPFEKIYQSSERLRSAQAAQTAEDYEPPSARTLTTVDHPSRKLLEVIKDPTAIRQNPAYYQSWGVIEIPELQSDMEIFDLTIRCFGKRWRRRRFLWHELGEAIRKVQTVGTTFQSYGRAPTHACANAAEENHGGLEHTEIRISLRIDEPHEIVGILTSTFLLLSWLGTSGWGGFVQYMQ